MVKNTMKYSFISFLLMVLTLLSTEALMAQNSLYSDVKAKKVGDIITVILQESTSGSSTSDSKLSSSSDGSAGGAIAGNFLPFQPTFGSDVNVEYGSDQKNLSNQRQLLQGFISVQIIEVSPGGDLVVEGNRLTEVNGEIHEMMLSGIVRQNDVNSENQVLSYRIANANISYQKKGGINKKTKNRGIIKKVVFAGVSLGLGAAVIFRSLK